jgi:hypothetical protein
MAWKCIGKRHMVVMLELLIHILLKVQANDLVHISFRSSSPPIINPQYFSRIHKVETNGRASTSFGPYSLPFLYPHSSKLDEVTKTLHSCLKDEIKGCVDTWEHVHTRKFILCLVRDNRKCLKEYDARLDVTCSECLLDCQKKKSKIGACFLTCFERHLKHHEKPSDVIYTQNP